MAAGMQVFRASGSFTPVSGRTYKIIAIGEGGGGTNMGSPGEINMLIWTAPNTTAIAVTVGSGRKNVGNASSFGSLLTARGGLDLVYGNQSTQANPIDGRVPLTNRDWLDGLVGIAPTHSVYSATVQGYGGKGAGAGGYNIGASGAVVITWDA